MKKLHLLTLTLLIITLASCEKATVTNDATADVFVKSKIKDQGTTVEYAVIHSVFSYSGIKSVTVTSPDGKTTPLSDMEGTGTSFYNEPTESEFTPTLPATAVGTYTYIVTFKDGTQTTYTNSLTNISLLPATITGLAKNVKGDSVYISWNAIANTTAYQLKVTMGTTQVYYMPAFSDVSVPLKSTLRLAFPYTGLSSFGAGTYTFELNGLLFESTANNYLQAVSSASKDIVIGQ